MSRRRQKFSLHSCVLDSECRGDIGWCWRIHLNTPWWHVGVALRPKDRYVRMVQAEPLKLKSEWIMFGKW